jgi:hypothetical protein
VTEVGLIFKNNGETFTLKQDAAGVDTFTVADGLTPLLNVQSVVSNIPYPGSQTWTVQIDNDSFIKFTGWYHGLSVQVKGKGNIFSGSEGMFGSWDYGGVRFKNGTVFNTAQGWASPGAIDLALDWQVPFAESLMSVPSSICDASPSCGPAPLAFACTDVRRALEQVSECDKTDCNHINVPLLKEACENDIILTNDTSFACEPSKLDPIIEEPHPGDFIPHPNDNVGDVDPDEPIDDELFDDEPIDDKPNDDKPNDDEPNDDKPNDDGNHGHPCETNCTHTSGCNPGMYMCKFTPSFILSRRRFLVSC